MRNTSVGSCCLVIPTDIRILPLLRNAWEYPKFTPHRVFRIPCFLLWIRRALFRYSFLLGSASFWEVLLASSSRATVSGQDIEVQMEPAEDLASQEKVVFFSGGSSLASLGSRILGPCSLELFLLVNERLSIVFISHDQFSTLFLGRTSCFMYFPSLGWDGNSGPSAIRNTQILFTISCQRKEHWTNENNGLKKKLSRRMGRNQNPK